MKKIFAYIENIWIGRDGRPSLKSILGIAFSINFMMNVSHAVYKWEVGRSVSDLAVVLGIEAGLIAALLGLTTYSNIQHRIIDKKRKEEDMDSLGPTE